MTEHLYPPPPPPPPADGFRLEEAHLSDNPLKHSLDGAEDQPIEKSARKQLRPDGSLDRVNPAIIAAAKDAEEWIAARKRNWPTAKRIEEKRAAQTEPEAVERTPGNDEASTAAGQTSAKGSAPDLKARKPMCRYFQRGKCRAGSSCKFSHDNRPSGPTIYKRFEPPVRNSLFVKLMQNDHDSEDLKILDFISQLNAAGLLD